MRPQLSRLVSAFEDEFTVELVPAGAEVSEDQLFVDLEADEQGRARRLELILLPHEDELFYLQFFVLLPFEATASRAADLARLIARINLKLPLVGFGMNEDEAWLFYRAIMPCSNAELDADLVLSNAWMVAYLVERFSDIIEDVATGASSLDEAFERAAAPFTATDAEA